MTLSVFDCNCLHSYLHYILTDANKKNHPLQICKKNCHNLIRNLPEILSEIWNSKGPLDDAIKPEIEAEESSFQ